MAKKKEEKEVKKTKTTNASAGVVKKLDDTEILESFKPNKVERVIQKYVGRRVDEMIDYRRGLKLEGRWREADQEYVPHELDFGTTRKRFETDQDTGLRSRMVPVGDITQQWRQASSAPTLLAKIQTALAQIIDNMPEGNLVALEKKYEATTDLAYALWKRNWSITNSKDKLKLLAFDLFKYGWAAQRTYPRLVKYPKRVLTEIDPENPENNKYEDREITWFNDVDREPLNVFKTWIDETSKPYDQFSTKENYYEIDYSYDEAKSEFGLYENWKYVPRDSVMTRSEQESKTKLGGQVRDNAQVDTKKRKDIVTIGFFESRLKDLFVIYIPKHKIIVYQSPLPNDDGYLSVTHTMYMLRAHNLPYGVSLWEIIRQNKALYDKMKNMTMDQLVLSIMKFGFFSGTNTNLGDGKIEIVPGQARQLTGSTGKPEVNWMQIPGPGAESWKGLETIENMMDNESGISPIMEGEITGKTLGEILHAKDSALKRLKTPLENLAYAVEQDAYVTLSWMSQIYSIPTVKEFTNEEEMVKYESEEQIVRNQLFSGEKGGVIATYLPQLALHLEDRDGRLYEGKESKFFQVGKDIQPKDMKWRGIFKVIPRSMIDKSQELIKASKMELFNIIVPILQFPPQMFAKAVKQIIKVNEEDPEDWLPDDWVDYLKNGGQPAVPAPEPLFADQGAGATNPVGGPSGVSSTMQGAMGGAPAQGAPTVVPQGQISGPTGPQMGGPMSGGKGLFGRGL